MSTISITTTGSHVFATTPFHPSFASRAKALGGRWQASTKSWYFDARDEARVRKLCLDLFGDDGSPIAASDLLTIRTSGVLDESKDNCEVRTAGRQIARVRGRDSGATLGDGVILLSGRFNSGGSMKNPRITWSSGTCYEVRDVPRAMAERVHAEYHGVTLLDATGAVVAEPTHEAVEPVLPDPAIERAAVEAAIAEAEGRLAGLRFRAAELAA